MSQNAPKTTAATQAATTAQAASSPVLATRKSKNLRTIGINMPKTERGDRVFNGIEALADQDDRTVSKTAFRLIEIALGFRDQDEK